ncbi:hypothetical protein L596_029916 [Steinernema carpocapsae]|uniref:Uncharacterized protein n=1 Tax=Steinernema carpocapsae TaxID=34508 RepID=A0A4U5LR64_STECR|nr:hypothetical protein L596_029916 [Steinernema carpocapsae]
MSLPVVAIFVFSCVQLGLGCHPNTSDLGNPTTTTTIVPTTPLATTSTTAAPTTSPAPAEIPLCVESGDYQSTQSAKLGFTTLLKKCRATFSNTEALVTLLRTDDSGKPICRSEDFVLIQPGMMFSADNIIVSSKVDTPSVDCNHPESFCKTLPNKILLKYRGTEMGRFAIDKLQFELDGLPRKFFEFPATLEETKTQWIGINVWDGNCDVGGIDQLMVYTAYYLVEDGKGITRVFNEEEKKKFLAGDVNAGKKPCEMDVCMA